MMPEAAGGRDVGLSTARQIRSFLGRIYRRGMAIKCGIREDFTQLLEPIKASNGELKRGIKGFERISERYKHIRPVEKKEALNPIEAKKLIDAIDRECLGNSRTHVIKDPDYFRMMAWIQALAGLRIGEVFGLRENSFNFDACEITVDSTISYKKVRGMEDLPITRFFDPKTGSGYRTFQIPAALIQEVKKWITKLPVHNITGETFLFSRPDGEVYHDTAVVNKIYKRAAVKAGLKAPISTHTLRHSYASWLFANDKHISEITQKMGHSSSGVTYQTYIHFVKPTNVSTKGDEGLDAYFTNGGLK